MKRVSPQAPSSELDRIRAERGRRSLRYYVREVTWPVVEPATPFVGGYHIDAICEHLEAVLAVQIRDLLITVPPRHTKSLCSSVAFPTWAWVKQPEIRFLCSSFSGDLSTEHAVLSRRVIESEFYRTHYATDWHLQTDQNVKTHYENTKRGYRISTSITATTTGRGGDILLADDPNNLKTIASEVSRLEVINWWKNVWSTRFNDPKTGRRIVIMQRGHEDDLVGWLLRNGWYGDILNLPTEYEPKRTVFLNGQKTEVDTKSCKTSIGWTDPRATDGELLAPDRFGPKEVANAKRDLGPTTFATQHQQRPAPAGGILFHRDKLKVITVDELPTEGTWSECRGWDFAATVAEPGRDPDYTAGVKMRRYVLPAGALYVVMHVIHKRYGPAEGDAVLYSTARSDGRMCKQREEQEPGSAGKKIIAAHVNLLAGLDYKGENTTGDKVTRATPFARQVDAGNVRILAGEWNQEYLDELELFPNGRHDDQVDGSSCAFNDLTLGGGGFSIAEYEEG